MRYIFTLLKDLPDLPAGAQIKCIGIDKFGFDDEDSYQMLDNCNRIHYKKVGKTILDNKEWFTKEIDYSSLQEIKCPKCGETRLCIKKRCWIDRNPDSNHYGANCDLECECPCGHKWKW